MQNNGRKGSRWDDENINDSFGRFSANGRKLPQGTAIVSKAADSVDDYEVLHGSKHDAAKFVPSRCGHPEENIEYVALRVSIYLYTIFDEYRWPI